MTDFIQRWKSVTANWKYYWNLYGGLAALLSSPYFGIAAALTIISLLFGDSKIDWVQSSLAIIPSLLGFSIGGFAVLLVFSSDRFLRIIAEGGSKNSLFLSASVTFVHFIVVQVLAIAFALLTTVGIPFARWFAVFGLFYSIMTALAACFVLFDIAQVYNMAAGTFEPKDEGKTAQPEADRSGEANRRRIS